MDKLYINCSVCGESIKITSYTGRYLLVKPCENCISFEVARAIKVSVEKVTNHVVQILKGKVNAK